MGVMIAASDTTTPVLNNSGDNIEKASFGRSPIWRHMENEGN